MTSQLVLQPFNSLVLDLHQIFNHSLLLVKQVSVRLYVFVSLLQLPYMFLKTQTFIPVNHLLLFSLLQSSNFQILLVDLRLQLLDIVLNFRLVGLQVLLVLFSHLLPQFIQLLLIIQFRIVHLLAQLDEFAPQFVRFL